MIQSRRPIRTLAEALTWIDKLLFDTKLKQCHKVTGADEKNLYLGSRVVPFIVAFDDWRHIENISSDQKQLVGMDPFRRMKFVDLSNSPIHARVRNKPSDEWKDALVVGMQFNNLNEVLYLVPDKEDGCHRLYNFAEVQE